MVRETRHLWVGNLPDNIREDRIREHFKRYGRVQNVKLLGRTEAANAVASVAGVAISGVCATVAFMDIKSASKAHNAEHVLDERTLTTEYYEPAAIPSAAGAPSAGSSPAGSGYSGSSSSVNSAPAPAPAPAPASVSRYHLSGGEEGTGTTCAIAATAAAPANWRGTNDSASDYCRRGNTPATFGRYQRNNSNTPYATTPPSNVERTTPHHRWYASGGERGATGTESAPSTPGGGTEGGRRRRRSGSGSSRSDSSSPEPSDASRASTPAGAPSACSAVAARTPPAHHHQWASTASGRPLAICVRNLPTRSTDSSLKDGLYHEYKKHGKVVWVKVVGQNADRYAVVRFKKPSDVEKALEVSQDKLFFGCKISVAPHQSCDEDADSAKPYETDIDEYHPKATRTLFIGNLEKDVTQQQLRDKFKHFGRIIEIDIKKGSGGGAGYAFCQYASISSVVEAIRAMDGEYVGGSRVKLGFGKPVATTCVWVDGLTEHTEKQVLGCVSRCGAATSVCVDRAAGAALVHFEQAAAAGAAVRELRRVAAQASAAEPDRPRLAVDYASRECQVTEAFYEQLEKHGGSAALTGTERLTGDLTPRYIPSTRHEPVRYGDGVGSRSRASSYGRGSSRTPRYSALEHYDPADYAADRRYRVYDELGSSPQAEDTPYEDRLQSVVVSPHRARRHRRDSSPDDRKHSKERHRGIVGTGTRRSRSGSRGGEKHAGRRRHRRRREGSGSRAGTPLRDEPDALPAEPRRPPRDRPPLPMSLPLPKFAAQLLRTAPSAPRPAPAPAPDSPPRPPSASSSSAGSAPHSPSLEERIRSLDEKYEKWSGSRVIPEATDRTRLRHRLLEVDINEVKPSEVVRSLLAKRSVFDEDSERLEGATRAPSPSGSPRARAPPCVPRALRYPFPAHPPPPAHLPAHLAACQPPAHDADADVSDRPADPRLNRPERPYLLERLGKFSESEYRLESRIRLRTPSTDKPQLDSSDRRHSPRGDRERPENERDPRRDIERRRRDSFYSGRESDSKSSSIDADEKDVKDSIDKVDANQPTQDSECLRTLDGQPIEESVECFDDKLLTPSTDGGDNEMSENQKASPTESSLEDNSVRDKVADILSNHVVEHLECKTEEKHIEEQSVLNTEFSIKSEDNKLEMLKIENSPLSQADKKFDHSSFQSKHEMDKCKEILIQNQINKELIEFEMQLSHLNVVNSIKPSKEIEDSREFIKSHDKNGKERYNQNMILEVFHNIKCEKENIEFDKTSEKDKCSSHSFLSAEKKHSELEKSIDDRGRSDREKVKHCKDRSEKDRHDNEREKSKSSKHERATEKIDKEKKSKDETTADKSHLTKTERVKLEKDAERSHKDKSDRSETDKSKHIEEKQSNHRHDHHRKDKVEKDKRKDGEPDSPKTKKDDKLKYEKPKKENVDSKRDSKKDADSIKSRKSSRDESLKDFCRKDSTDSSTSRASHDSIKIKEEHVEIKDEPKPKAKLYNDKFTKPESEKDHLLKSVDSLKVEGAIKIKTEIKEEKDIQDSFKIKIDSTLEQTLKCKSEITEKQRHYSVDSPSLECKRKERLNSCSSLPSHIGHKRRMSSQDSIDSVNEDGKKCKNESKCPERRDSKDSRSGERHKTTKFNKGHFAKLIESKTKDDKKNQVKPPDDSFLELSDIDTKKSSRKSPKGESDEKTHANAESPPEGLRNDLDFLATLELRSSEEDERQKALRKEMKEKKRIQQLQQIQELQMQQEQHPELLGKFKDEKKQKTDEKKKDAAREKRMSTDRKSRDEKIDKNDNNKRKTRKPLQSTDTSDSDEPKKHSIFDIVDDEPTYISMYDKVKARSCKNMQKQEEEKRQEKIKAKFSQLKQSRAKREEKKRSSWDEDSDSENDRRKSQRISMCSSTDDENIAMQSKKREKSHGSIDYDHIKTNDYFNIPSAEEDSRNKLSRKNSRTRIISDTSDDDASKRSISRSPCFLNEMRKEFMSEFDTLHKIKEDSVVSKESGDKIKKNSLLNLFGKSDSDDSKLKSSLESNDNKASYMKTFLNDFSSESESIVSNRHPGEIRKKHKRKQKKHKFSFSDEETKVENNEIALNHDGESRHKNSEKLRRHSNKREKRKEKIRDSIDADDSRDEKFKSRKDKKPLNNCFDSAIEAGSNNIRKDGKMEDIFGPLSDESDRDVSLSNKLDFTPHDSTFNITSDQLSATINTENIKSRDKEEYRRRKEKRRRDKRPYTKEDENSLDVDAVSKAIEARLIADTMTDNDNRPKTESLSECVTKSHQNDINSTDKELFIEASKISDRQIEKMKRDFREKKKKKKKNKDDRPSRKDHHHFNNIEKYDKVDNFTSEKSLELSPKSMLLDIPLPNDPLKVNNEEKSDDCKALSESPSLPRLTDSPPNAPVPDGNADSKNKDSDTPGQHSGDNNMNIDCIVKNDIEVNDIPMPPPPFENIVQDISEVPLPKDPIPASNSDVSKEQHSLPSFDTDVDISEDAVRSISNIDKDTEKICDKIDAHASKVEKKSDEKPRAIISQEETEDAVAALLGESFGGKINTFTNCYEEAENSPAHQIEIESTTIENENIPEEDAEEMRQAVQNLNASEMEMKPDTPVSDNDLLLIDTDTEEADDAPQDSIDRLPVNIIATNQSLNNGPEQSKLSEVSNVVIPKSKSLQQTPETTESKLKLNENESKLQLTKRETTDNRIQHATSTATPVITSWTLSNNKVIEPHVLNMQQNKFPNRDTNDNKPTHITANIVQIKASQNQGLSSSLRPIIAPTRVSAPYQVINHMIRPQAPNMQPPTIKIPEPHILYQKPSGIVISPRMTNDSRLQSPKVSPQGEGMTSPRLANMTILSTSPQSLNSVGLASPSTIQQRSPGQVTVVRMQQPPLSPIQAMHLPHGARSMISPNRPNSVLVQTQGAPIQFNRLPVTPVLAPISKQMSTNNLIQQNKGIGINSSPLHQQKIIAGDCRKNDQRNITENLNENSKIILSPTTLQHSTNPTVMAQNRLISMQNAIHAGNLNPTLHLANKVLLNNVSHITDKRENLTQKSEQHNHIPFGSAPIIHVTGVNHSTASIIQSGSKPVMCTLQETNTINRAQGSNVIHTLNSQRLLTTAPISTVIQIDANKCPPSVLSMATIRSPTVLTKLESSNSVAVTTSSLSNVVMTPLLLKTSSTPGTIRLSTKSDVDHPETHTPAKQQNHLPHHEDKPNVKKDPPKREMSTIVFDALDKQKDILLKPKHVTSPVEFTATKCETDFEELLKDNTNEIKVTNDPEKKLEVNVGKNVTLFTADAHCRERKNSVESFQKEVQSDTIAPVKSLVEMPLSDRKEEICFDKDPLDKEFKAVMDTLTENSHNVKIEPEVIVKDNNLVLDKDPLSTDFDEINNDGKTLEFQIPIKDENKTFDKITSPSESNQLKNLDDNDSWSAKDVNIESVIKKVDSLCNEISDPEKKDDAIGTIIKNEKNTLEPVSGSESAFSDQDSVKPMEIQTENEHLVENSSTEESTTEKITTVSKRGGRSVRGKRTEKNPDRVQTRQISKPSRGGTSAKRGRGRAKVDKKIKSLVNLNANNMPGDIYDFHEDSGDESATSPNKNETRPRLILTIKSPLSGQSNAIATSTLSITPKDQIKSTETKPAKEEKAEDFVSPSPNTRKSRRLQEKDVQRTTVDDVIEDVIKGATTQTKLIKDAIKKRPTRQAGVKVNQADKTGSDIRKSPRGVKRTRDRSLSDASVDSSDEKAVRRDDAPTESKVPKLAEPPIASKVEPDPPQPAKINAPVINNVPPPTPTPIMKPPKKMISEISAKLASVFEAAASTPPPLRMQPHLTERLPMEAEKQPPIPIRELRNPEPATATPAASELMAVATGEARVSVSTTCGADGLGLGAAGCGTGGEAALARRLDGVGGGMVPESATEAGDARVQSPALPHRPPDAHRIADRATPLLIRGGDGEGASVASVANVASGAGAGTARLPRGYAGTASLPRGAHHPPHPPHAPLAAHLHHPHAKQVAVVGPHHHPGAASRVTITSVPTISPQGQIALGDGMYPHFSHQHYQMYQQHFRATQHESRATPSPYTRTLEAEGCEAPTPPLELRRPPSARVPRPAHSPSPADRLIMYAAGCGRSPPPAHGTSRLPGALPPVATPGPPHASQVPREADSLQMLLRRYPVMWQGLLALKNDSAAVQMHFVGGNPGVAGDTLPRHTDGSTPPLRIAQRMRLEPVQLDQVHRKMKLENEHCILLALPCGRDHMDVLQQSTNLTAGFITYLQRKQAAGIVNVAPPGHHQAMYTVHIFPSCDFANENLNRIAPDLMHRVADIAHLLIVIATV